MRQKKKVAKIKRYTALSIPLLLLSGLIVMAIVESLQKAPETSE